MGAAARSRRTDFLQEDVMTRTPKARRWIHRPHPSRWLTDTRDPDYSTARLISGAYGSRSS
jgi:hypothetical protein